MAIRLLVTYLLTAFIGCDTTSHSNDLMGAWVGVNNGRGSGLILDFKPDDLIFGAITTDSTTKFKYTYNQSNGALMIHFKGQDELLGKIKWIATDRIALLTPGTPDTIRLELIRMKDKKLTISKAELLEQLKNTSWATQESFGSVRMDFLQTHRWENSREPFEAMFHYWSSTPHKEYEVWNVGAYNGKLFVFFTFHQTEYNTRQVLEVNSNEIVITPSPWEDSTVQKVKWTKTKSLNIIGKLTEKAWRSISVDTTFSGERDWSPVRNEKAKELQAETHRVPI